jgi:hypothetical protein
MIWKPKRRLHYYLLGRRLRRQKWHRWFAWKPVRIENDQMAWLQYVSRKYTFFGSYAAYIYLGFDKYLEEA